MKLAQPLLLLSAAVKSQFTVTIKLCTDRDRTPKVVYAATGTAQSLQMQIWSDPFFSLDLPYNVDAFPDMTKQYSKDIDSAPTVRNSLIFKLIVTI